MQLNIECKYKVGDTVYIYTMNTVYEAIIIDVICVANSDESGEYIIKYKCKYCDDKIIEHFAENQLFNNEEECEQFKQNIILSKFYNICKKYNSLQSQLNLNISKKDIPIELHNLYDAIYILQTQLFNIFDSDEKIREEYKFDCDFFDPGEID